MKGAIRRARSEDADFLAWAILTAARSHLAKGWFDIVLNRPEGESLDFLRRLTLTPSRSWWHYSRFYVAEIDARLVAALSAFRAGDAYPLSQAAMTEAAREAGWGDAELQGMWQRGSYIFSCTLEASDDVWAFENIGTLPTHRGRGLAGQLIERGIEEAGSNGARQAQITFVIGNEAAERAYAKAGFRLKDEKRHPDFEAVAGAPGLRRYIRDL